MSDQPTNGRSDVQGRYSGRAPTRRTVLKAGAIAIGLGATGLGAIRLGGVARAQDPSGTPGAGPGGGQETLDEFVGVTTDGTVIPDLFPVQATGISTAPVVEAATAFLAALTDEQRAATLFAVDDDEWRKWSNIDGYQRQGVSLREMDDAQREAA